MLRKKQNKVHPLTDRTIGRFCNILVERVYNILDDEIFYKKDRKIIIHNLLILLPYDFILITSWILLRFDTFDWSINLPIS